LQQPVQYLRQQAWIDIAFNAQLGTTNGQLERTHVSIIAIGQ
jgi:hypothetical protein